MPFIDLLPRPVYFTCPMAIEKKLAESLVWAGRKLAERRMIAGTDGNLSARQASGTLLITPSGVRKGDLTVDQLIETDPDGHPLGGGQPSSEIAMHLAVYRERPDVMAAVHAHPPHATAFAAAGHELPYDILPEAVLFLGPIPLTEYAPPGTAEVPKSLMPYIKTANVFLLRNHGVLTLGRDVHEAYNRHETVERLAEIIILANQLGQVNSIPASDLKRLDNLRLGTEKE